MNLKGGYILLSLCAISLALSGEPVTITNADVLKKLSEFQMYVGTDEFKSQPKVGLKPVLVQYRSSESKINGVILCKCGFDTNNKKLIISGTDGEKLSIQIECVFIDNPEDVKVTPYVLQSAKVTAYRGVIGDLDILGDLDIDGDLTVDGITSKGIANTGGLANIGNVAISGDLSASGKITGGEIVENMSGYSFIKQTGDITFAGAVKNGNKVTFAEFGSITTGETLPVSGVYSIGYFNIPTSVGEKLIPDNSGYIYVGTQGMFENLYSTPLNAYFILVKDSNSQFSIRLVTTGLSTNKTYKFRLEVTFLLSENLVPQE